MVERGGGGERRGGGEMLCCARGGGLTTDQHKIYAFLKLACPSANVFNVHKYWGVDILPDKFWTVRGQNGL